MDFSIHKASANKVNYLNNPTSAYQANGNNTLTDGVRGTFNISKYWHGFFAKDLVATIDLGKETSVRKISLGCLQNTGDWIFLPTAVQFEISADGVNYKAVGQELMPLDKVKDSKAIYNFATSFASQQAKYVRVTAKILQKLPKGHSGEGKPAWLFADEIVVE